MKKTLTAFILFIILSTPAMAENLSLGTIFELTGQDAATAQEAMNGALLAVKKYNNSDRRYTITLETTSTSGSPENVLKTVEELRRKADITAVTGLISDDAALEAAPDLQAAELPFLCTGAQADNLAQSVGDNIFTLAVPDIRIGQLLAEFATNTIQTANIVLIRSDMSDSCARQADSFARRFKQNNGKIMAELRITEPDEDLHFIVEKLQSLTPPPPSNNTVVDEGIEASNFSDSGAAIITEERAAEPAPQIVETVVVIAPAQISIAILDMLRDKNQIYRVMGGSSFDSVSMRKSISNWPDTVFYTSQADLTAEDELVQDFVKTYTEFFGSAPQSGYSALGFDSIMLLADTADRHGNTIEAIRSGLPAINNFSGVSGKISFQGRSAHKPLYIMQAQSGQISLAAGLD